MSMIAKNPVPKVRVAREPIPVSPGFEALDRTHREVIEVLQEDYVRTARAKGIARRLIDRRHVLPNALLPVTTVIGLQVGLLLSGAILTETVFAWGGMGTWIYDAVAKRDFPVLQGGILFIVVVFVVVNLLVDIGYALIDPRIRLR